MDSPKNNKSVERVPLPTRLYSAVATNSSSTIPSPSPSSSSKKSDLQSACIFLYLLLKREPGLFEVYSRRTGCSSSQKRIPMPSAESLKVIQDQT
ncbi:hypothetical protein MKW98_018199 [Papaver atlanticum]|uniref:Uncharacterized protein n=1 Tax=Papaver atlanticum TaxID=357466 RepID=A0AAD4X4A0_9MAGN|nr:hypothetical protein MKW98_018199 [Papaver atlanticum]